MTRLLLVAEAGIVLSACAACSVDTSTEARNPTAAVAAEPAAAAPAIIATPQNAADRHIRRNLVLAIDGDSELRERDISFIVANGDVSVTGLVRTEDERKKINDLAMNIDGVKSVANALRVAE